MSERFDVRLELPGFDAMPGRVPEIDEVTRAKLARVILDETVELATYNRGASVMYGRLDDAEFANLYKPLVDVLRLDPANDPPPLRAQIDRASILGLVPSQKAIYARTTLSKVQEKLGFRPKFRFQDWLKADYVEAGQKLAGEVGGRPTRIDVEAAGKGQFSKLGDFPTLNEIRGRFGRLSVFHELIGYPSCKGWKAEDYLDWASAFYRQNTSKDITPKALGILSIRGVGPSHNSIYGNFGSLTEYKRQARENYEETIEEEAWGRGRRLANAKIAVEKNPLLADIFAGIEDNERRVLQATGQFMIAASMMPEIGNGVKYDLAVTEKPDVFVRKCLSRAAGDMKAADIEIQALQLGVYDDLWPMYRFENANLRLE